MAFKLDPTISWGDIGMGIGLMFTGILAFTGLSEQVALQNERITAKASYSKQVNDNLERYKVESYAADTAIKTELKTELRDINQKLDRLVERIPANGRNGN